MVICRGPSSGGPRIKFDNNNNFNNKFEDLFGIKIISRKFTDGAAWRRPTINFDDNNFIIVLK